MVRPWSFWLCGCFGFLGHLVVILVPLPSQDEPHPCLLSGWMSPVGPCPPPVVFFAGRLGGWVFVRPSLGPFGHRSIHRADIGRCVFPSRWAFGPLQGGDTILSLDSDSGFDRWSSYVVGSLPSTVVLAM
jgi:hypothetical protein